MSADRDEELVGARRRIAELEAEITRLHSRLEDERAADDLRTRLAAVGAAGVIGAPTEHQALLEGLVRTAMHVLGARAGSLYLIDEGADELIFEVAFGEKAAPLRGQRIPIGQGIAGWVAATGQALAVADVQQDPRWASEIGRTVGYAPRTMLAMPLLLHDEVTGVLQLLDKEDGTTFSGYGDPRPLRPAGRRCHCPVGDRAQLAGIGEGTDLTRRAATFLDRTEETAEYRDVLRLADLVGGIARQGEAGRRLCLEIVGALAAYLATQANSLSKE